MANRNDELYGAYLNAHIYSGGNCGDLSSGDPRPHRGTWVDFRGNDTKAAVALGQMHGRAGAEALSMERLVAKVDEMVAWDPTRGGVDLSAAKAAMKNVADAGKAAEPTKDTDQDPGKNITLDGLKQAFESTRIRTVREMQSGVDLTGSVEIDITPRSWKGQDYFIAAPILMAVIGGTRMKWGKFRTNYAIGAMTELRIGFRSVTMVVMQMDKTEAEIRESAKEVSEYVDSWFPCKFRDIAWEAQKEARSKEEAPPNAGDLADMKAATQGLGVVTEKVVERVVTEAGVTEQTASLPRLDPPNMGDVWVPRLGGPPITLMFFDPTCGSEGAWRTGYGDRDWITTDALRELYWRKFVASCGNSWISAVATWAAVRAKVTYPARVADLVVGALGPDAKMSEIKAAVAALALSEKSASPAK